MASPIIEITVKQVFNVTPGPEGVSQIRVENTRPDKGMAMLAYRSGDLWLEGHWLAIPAVCTYLTKVGASLFIEEPKVVEEKKAIAKADKIDLKVVVLEYLNGRAVATTVEVAAHLGKPTAVANSVLCAMERRDMVSSKQMDGGITWKAKKKS
jgi:hypothetical protein